MQSEAPAPVYKRIVLKLSGESLRERGAKENISPQIVREIAERIKEVKALGVQTSVVIGGGNIWRGLAAHHRVVLPCGDAKCAVAGRGRASGGGPPQGDQAAGQGLHEQGSDKRAALFCSSPGVGAEREACDAGSRRK